MDPDIERTPLVKKYGIPIAHLDFKYIKTCDNAREMEKIVHILRSGEEGYFPDLTKYAEDKLLELKPNSKQFRYEQSILTKDTLAKSEWEKENEPVVQWTNDIKIKDDMLTKLSESTEDDLNEIRPPVRHEMKKINSNSKPIYVDKEKKPSNVEEAPASNAKSSERIKSFEYDKWDKYDAETEILKMDLAEERVKEEVERKNKENLKRQNQMNKKIEIINEDKKFLNKLTDVEKENLSIMHKDRGNDYFKVKEYDNAIHEYTESLEYMETAAGYNNRAIAYLKLMKYNYCVDECDKCLKIEPNNIKALLRKAQGFLGMDQRRSAYDVYVKVLTIDSSNKIALDGVKDLKKQLPDLAPKHATRLFIEEDSFDTYPFKKEINTITEIVDDPPEIIKEPAPTTAISTKPVLRESGSDLNKENQNPVNKEKINCNKGPKVEPKSKDAISEVKKHSVPDTEKKKPTVGQNTQKPDQLKEIKKDEKKTKQINKNKKDDLQDDNYGLEDLASLIMPKKLKKSKVALALEAMKNPKLNSIKNPHYPNNPNCRNNISDSNKKDQLKFFPDNEGLKNLKFIQEMKRN